MKWFSLGRAVYIWILIPEYQEGVRFSSFLWNTGPDIRVTYSPGVVDWGNRAEEESKIMTSKCICLSRVKHNLMQYQSILVNYRHRGTGLDPRAVVDLIGHPWLTVARSAIPGGAVSRYGNTCMCQVETLDYFRHKQRHRQTHTHTHRYLDKWLDCAMKHSGM